MADMLQVNRALTVLNLADNHIGGHYIKQDDVEGSSFKVGDAVRWNGMAGTISKEKESDGKIFVHFQQGIQAIAQALKVNRALKSANLGMNNIGDEGAIAISAALESNNMLTETDLTARQGSVKIGPAGAQAIAKMLAVNRALNSVDLRFNQIPGEGKQQLRDAVKGKNTSLQM